MRSDSGVDLIEWVGAGESAARAFQTLRRLDAGGSPTAEEFHYAYCSGGQLLEAAFAQSPAIVNGQPYVPAGGQPYYDAAHPASSRARAHYEYDMAGRLTQAATYAEGWGDSAYGSPTLAYETSGANRGLKTGSTFWTQSASDPTQFAQERTEAYGYDASLDYLTSASYGDGLPNASASWGYDAAGNRNDAVCDSLNRATSLGGVAVTSDVLGNRLTKGGVTCGWDALNRLTSLTQATTGGFGDTTYTGVAGYQYRADGMRVLKETGPISASRPTTRYRYDGQMGMEDAETQGSTTTVTRYGLGARGVDFIERTQGSTVTTGFPVYDAHGNDVATLSRNGSGGFNLGDRRSYDAWGVVRSQQSGGDPKLRYCASLGHKQDDESGLVYMRARYYEPSSGRFVSEDPSMDGKNYFAYCQNNPISGVDESGKQVLLDSAIAAGLAANWMAALQSSSTLRSVAFRFLSLFEFAYDVGQMMPMMPGDKLVRTDLRAALTTITFNESINIIPSGPVQNIVGFFAGYSTAIAIMLFQSGLSDVGSTDFTAN